MSDFRPRDIYTELTKLGEAWAEANYKAELAEESKKSLLSELSAESEEKAASAREAYALRHPDYVDYIKDMVKLRFEANKAKVKYDSAKTYADMLRTEAANHRAAMREAT